MHDETASGGGVSFGSVIGPNDPRYPTRRRSSFVDCSWAAKTPGEHPSVQRNPPDLPVELLPPVS